MDSLFHPRTSISTSKSDSTLMDKPSQGINLLAIINLHETGFHSFANKAKSILLETTAQAHTNIYKKMHAFSTYTQILHFCVLCFPISCAQNLSPKNFYLRYQNPRFALSAGKFFTLSSLCHPQWRRCQFMLSLLNHVKKQPGLQLLWDRNRSLCKYLCTHRKSQRV